MALSNSTTGRSGCVTGGHLYRRGPKEIISRLRGRWAACHVKSTEKLMPLRKPKGPRIIEAGAKKLRHNGAARHPRPAARAARAQDTHVRVQRREPAS